MKKIIATLLFAACLLSLTACSNNQNTASSSAASGASSVTSQSDESVTYEVTNNYGGIYTGEATLVDYHMTETTENAPAKGTVSAVKYEFAYLDDTFGTFSTYDSTGAKTLTVPFTSEGNKLRVLNDYAEDDTTVNKEELNFVFEEKDGVITATGDMKITVGEEWISQTVTLTKQSDQAK